MTKSDHTSLFALVAGRSHWTPRFVQGLGLLCASFLFTTPAVAEDFLQFDTQLKRDNNLGNSRVRYAVADNSLINTLNVGRIATLGDDPITVILNGKLASTSYNRFTGLSHRDLGGTIEVKKKWGLGPYAPVFSGQLGYERQLFEQADRTQDIQHAELRLSKRVIENLNLNATWRLTQHHAADNRSVEEDYSGAVYDGRYHTWSVSADYSIFGDHLLGLQYSQRKGDLVVTTVSDSAAIYSVAKAIRPDPAFGADRDAYRLDGEIKSWGFSYTIPLNRQWDLQFENQKHDSRVSNGVTYAKRVYSVSAHFKF
ncbi:hypothetical protein RF679_16010 [Undibacterium cyanobacteriorum]|uniref:Uncharacterized protein n=1 Tax=Undibacterium cyanobacteriorum TaxID=3073561 RepID=A0ABY9RFX7_9BURK|nr:hypothetical protein [Undibacterium sp. 20NA77.5]WMW80137.1 hypothetical protein RF679_16010 [Undibacterium sp. 20NA77.5]